MKKIVLVMFCSLLVAFTFAQRKEEKQKQKEEKRDRINQLIKQEEDGALIYQKQSIFGGKLSTDGYGAFYEIGHLKTPIKTNTYSLEIGERKNAKEEKLTRGNNYGFTYWQFHP